MTNVTYLLGAGASANAIPVVKKFNKDVQTIKGILENFLKKNMNEGAYSSLPEILQSKNSVLEKIVGELQWLLIEADNHQTIDTLAKKFYLTNSDDLNKLKRILIVYFLIRQALTQPDKRYDSFLAAISTKKNKEISFSKNIKILTWNYDVQLELSIKRYVNGNISSLKELFQMLPNNTSIEHDASTLFDHNKFGVVKINGNAYWSKEIKDKNFPSTILDTFFIKNYTPVSIIAQAINEYDHIFNNTDEGNKFLKLFNFAWESDTDFIDKYSGYNGNLHTAEMIANDTEILVVIGYSFPIFNREIDSKLFNSMQKLRKVYIQDKNPERIKSTMINAFKIFQGRHNNQNFEKPFQLESNLNQFVIPFEL